MWSMWTIFPQWLAKKKELREELTYDGVHPDKNGYAIMESILLDVLKKIL